MAMALLSRTAGSGVKAIRAASARVVAAENSGQTNFGHPSPEPLGLLDADGVERRVGVLHDPRGIERGLTVANQIDHADGGTAEAGAA